MNCDLVLDFKQSGWLLASPYYMRYSTTSTLVNASLLELVSRARRMSQDEEIHAKVKFRNQLNDLEVSYPIRKIPKVTTNRSL